jgi:hypothetical protein
VSRRVESSRNSLALTSVEDVHLLRGGEELTSRRELLFTFMVSHRDDKAATARPPDGPGGFRARSFKIEPFPNVPAASDRRGGVVASGA